MHSTQSSPGGGVTPAGTLLRIGDVAARAGTTVDALRFYEKRGLLKPERRRSSGYREYTPDAVRLVRFIRRAQDLGFTLAEVGELARLRERAWRGDGPRNLRRAAAAKIANIEQRIRELHAIRGALARLVAACDAACDIDGAKRAPCHAEDCCVAPTGGVLDCPLIEALEAETPPAPVPGERATKRVRSPARHLSQSTRREQ